MSYNVAPKSDTIICPVMALDSSLARENNMTNDYGANVLTYNIDKCKIQK